MNVNKVEPPQSSRKVARHKIARDRREDGPERTASSCHRNVEANKVSCLLRSVEPEGAVRRNAVSAAVESTPPHSKNVNLLGITP